MPKADLNKAGWEQSEFPILCESCTLSMHCASRWLTTCPGLGDNPFIRMVRIALPFGTCLLTYSARQNKNTAALVEPARVLSPSSAGNQAQMHVTKRR